ncbi:MAG: YrzE family protein [Bacillota bacterium]
MKLNLNFSNRLKKMNIKQNTTISYSALWYGIIAACLLWLALVGAGTFVILAVTEGTIYSMAGLLKLVTWTIFFLGGYLSAYRAGIKGWQHGLWTGIFLGLFSAIFLLEIVPAVIAWQDVLFQWFAAAILGTSGGLIGQKMVKDRKDRKGYSFKEAKKERFVQLDRSK